MEMVRLHVPAVSVAVIDNYKIDWARTRGVAIEGTADEARFSKNGDNAGFKSMLVGYLSGRGVVVMTNSDNGMALALAILRAVQRVYGWQPVGPTRPPR